MLYKAFVKDKQTKEYLFIEMECRTKKDFIINLRFNGYSVNEKKVKRKELFDWILNNTNCTAEDWSLRKIPEENNYTKEELEMIEEMNKRYQAI